MQNKEFFQQTFISVALAGLLYYLNIIAIPVKFNLSEHVKADPVYVRVQLTLVEEDV